MKWFAILFAVYMGIAGYNGPTATQRIANATVQGLIAFGAFRYWMEYE